MTKRIRIFFLLLFFSTNIFSQQKIGEFESASGFRKTSQAVVYSLRNQNGYQVNLQIIDNIIRSKYDSNFSLIASYDYFTQDYTFNQSFRNTPIYNQDLQFGQNYYEVYSDKKDVIVITPDFKRKKDSVVFSQSLKNNTRGEMRVGILPFSNSLGILCFSKKENKLYLYKWHQSGLIDSIEIALPESSLSPDEIKKYTKAAAIKYKAAFRKMRISKADETSVIGIISNNALYYSNEKIWLLTETPFYTGYNILEIDIKNESISSSNYMINDMRRNVEAKKEFVKKPYALIWGNNLIIRNSSYYTFEYEFYDLSTKQLIKKYDSFDGDSLTNLIQSDFNQKGTFISGKIGKKIDNEKAFIRKIAAGEGFIIVSKSDIDSITITTGSIKEIQGIEGTLLTAAQFILTYGGNKVFDYLLSGYITAFRDKLVYCHSRFSLDGFNLSSANNITTKLDNLLKNVEKRDFNSPSTTIFTIGKQYVVAVFNISTRKFELFTISNEQDN